MPVANIQSPSETLAADKGQEKSQLRELSDHFESATTAGILDGGTIGGLHYLYERYSNQARKTTPGSQSSVRSFPWSGFTKYCNKSGHTVANASTALIALNLCGFSYNHFIPWRRNQDERTQEIIDSAALALGVPFAAFMTLRTFRSAEDQNMYSTLKRIRALDRAPGNDAKFRQHRAAVFIVPAAIKFGGIALGAGIVFLHGSSKL